MSIRALPCLSIALCLAACAQPAPSDDPVSVSVRWGLSGASALPDEVGGIDINTCTQLDGEEEECVSFSCSVDALTLDLPPDRMQPEGCRTAAGTEVYGNEPVLVRRGLPAGARVRFELVGTPGGGDSTPLYVGHAGPLVLGEGERRFVELQMYPVGASIPLPGVNIARFLHTATRLPDGRVLVAGGFDQVQALTECPAERTFPEGSACFQLTSSREALAFDPGGAIVEPIRSPMLAARAGHTATALPDGRVLLTGGAPSALMAMIPQGVAAASGFRFEIFPLAADGTDGAHATYEIFDAFLGGEADDPDRDGDLGRGGFLGTAGTTNAGAMNVARFMHAAAAIPANPDRVLLAGGSGAERSAATYEIFDARKPGGYGFYRGGGALAFPRALPGAVGFEGTVWIFGGRLAASNEELAEIWSPIDDDPNGATQPASSLGSFPSSSPTEDQQRPEFSLHRPAVTTIDNGQRALVVGWYGPQCELGMMAPVFAMDGVETEYCNTPSAPATRSYTVSVERGLTAPTQVRPHAFGAMAETFEFAGPERDDGTRGPPARRVVFTGGAANASWTANRAVDVFSGAVDGTGAAMALSGVTLSLQSERIFHTTTGLPGLGAVTLGGLTFGSPALDRIVLEDEVEVFFLPR